MNFNRKKQSKTAGTLVALVVVLSGMLGALMQGKIMDVSANMEPIIVGISEMSFGIVFPGENITGKEFSISLAEGEDNDIEYQIIKERSDKEGRECEETNPNNCLPDLCPYITPILIDDEDESTLSAYLSPNKDTNDRWKIELEVPAIAGFVAQSFIGTPTGESGLHGCRLYVSIKGEEDEEKKGSISGYKFNDYNGNAVLDEGEEGLGGWEIQLVRCPYSPLESEEKDYIAKSTINNNPEQSTTGYCSVIQTTITDTGGYYIFEDLEAGDYGINEKTKDGWNQTYPWYNEYYYLNLQEGKNLAGIDFLNHYYEEEGEEAVCGNETVEEGETCDDGNLIDGDGCESNCTLTSNPSRGGGGSVITLRIRDEKVSNITETAADFTWLTNLKANSRVVCSENETWKDILGDKPNYGYVSSTVTYNIDPTVTNHKVTLDGLKPDTKYSCRVVSAKGSKEVKSTELDFRTLKEEGEIIKVTDLVIFDLTTGGVTTTSFDSSWKTNKDATTCAVYGESSILLIGSEPNFGYIARTTGCDQLDKQSTSHNNLFSGLKPCTVYYYRAIAYNGVQRTISPEQRVMTACVAGTRTIAGTTSGPQISSNPPSTENKEEGGEVKEAETIKAPDCGLGGIGDIVKGNCVNDCMIWLLILIIVLLLLYIWKNREDEKRRNRLSNKI